MANLGMQNFALSRVFGQTTPILKVLVHFCLKVYFPAWFEIKLVKLEHQITNGSKHLFSLIKRINSLSNEEIREVALDALQRNGYFAHPENLLIAMLGDGDAQIRSMAVIKVVKVIALPKELFSSFAAEKSFTSERQCSSMFQP